MADKKNEILEEQRRAREEFLELKKMQHGEIEAPPKPSEVALVPKTPKEKWDNFWFQYKWYVVAITATVVVLSVLIAQCVSRPKYDFEAVYFTYTPVLDEQTEKVSDYLKKYGEDVNGDGEVKIQVINCSFSDKGNVQYKNTMLTKLQSLIAGDEKALIYITDSESYKYLEGISDSTSIFEGEPLAFGEDFYKSTETENFGALPEGLQVSCRRVSDTVLESKKNIKPLYNAAKNLIEKLSDLN
ncbi:MAG: hypothetical protein II252_06575 [Clostridia bacterium]|nr:hypothetical protein [Clostridia bacterium]